LGVHVNLRFVREGERPPSPLSDTRMSISRV
jgi:hypothetical protein